MASVPAYYKAVGQMAADTLDNPLLSSYAEVLAFFPGPSLDLFAHRTQRTTVSNQFDMALDQQLDPTPDVLHHPLLHPDLADRRDSLDVVLRHRRFSVVLIDPPYSPLQQKQLYSAGTHRTDLATLMVDTPAHITRLYQVSWDFATTHSDHAVLLYGYKVPPLSRDSPWRLSLLWILGSGAHPAITGQLYLSDRVSAADERRLLEILAAQAQQQGADGGGEVRWLPQPPRRPRSWHVGVHRSQVYLYPRASDYARHRQTQDPPSHPAYLSAAMRALRHTPARRWVVHSALAAPYHRSAGQPCFVAGTYTLQRELYAPQPWADVLWVLILTPTA